MLSALARSAPVLAIALVLGFLSPQAAAQLPGSTLLSIAGTDKEAVTDFIGKLQKAVEADDRAAVARLVSFPLRASIGKSDVTIKDKKQFLSKYPAIFGASLKKTIAAASLENSWANYQGVMWDSGRFWVRPDAEGTLRIVTINAPIGGG